MEWFSINVSSALDAIVHVPEETIEQGQNGSR